LLQVGWSGDQILVEVRFSAPVRTGPGAHPVSCAVGIKYLSWGKVAVIWHW